MYRLQERLTRLLSLPVWFPLWVSTVIALVLLPTRPVHRPSPVGFPSELPPAADPVGSLGVIYGTPALIEGVWRDLEQDERRSVEFVLESVNGVDCREKVAFTNVESLSMAKELRALSSRDCRHVAGRVWRIWAWEKILGDGVPYDVTNDLKRRAEEQGIDIPYRGKDPGFRIMRSLVVADYLFVGDEDAAESPE